MEISEKELEDMICLENRSFLEERGLDFPHEKLIRQLNLGVYGISDLIGISYERESEDVVTSISIYVYELKKDHINQATLTQVSRYISGLKRYFSDLSIFENIEVKFMPVLIGSGVDLTGNFVYMLELVENIEVYTYSLKIDGIYFSWIRPSEYGPANFDVLGFGSLAKIHKNEWLGSSKISQIEN